MLIQDVCAFIILILDLRCVYIYSICYVNNCTYIKEMGINNNHINADIFTELSVIFICNLNKIERNTTAVGLLLKSKENSL